MNALEPNLKSAIDAGRDDIMRSLLREVHEDIYAIRLLTDDACRRLNEDAKDLEHWYNSQAMLLERPNSMNDYGFIMDQHGYHVALKELVSKVVSPLATAAFKDVGGQSLDQHHGFVVSYGPAADRVLGFHVDDSEVTLNLCLSDDFEGGDLFFRGRRCLAHTEVPPLGTEFFEYAHQPGVALLHAGKHRHGAFPTDDGERRNVILWCRSSSYRAHRLKNPGCPKWCQKSLNGA